MFEALIESQLEAITGGNNDAPMPPPHPGRAASAPLSLGTHVKPIAEAATQRRFRIYSTEGAS